MSDKISSGTLPLIPENIFYAKEKLTRKLKREPTDEELAQKLGMTTKQLNDVLKMKTEYTENSLSPSFQRGHDVYYGSPLQKNNRKLPLFDNPNRYDSGGKKRQMKYKKRTHTKRYKKSKSRRKSMKKYV